MKACQLSINVDAPFQRTMDEGWLRQVVDMTLAAEGLERPVELGLVITDAKTIRRLNREYRGEDEDTDVLAFALIEETDAARFVLPPDGVSRLGEVLISHPQAAVQAKEHNHPLKHEVALLIVHGVLHLLGYDHGDSETEKLMRAKEEKVLEQLSDEHLL
jgi:probable rRNA maturation factor